MVFYSYLDGYYRPENDMSEQRKLAYSGTVSKAVSSKIRDRVLLLYYLSSRRRIFNPCLQKDVWFKLSFLTLTLSASQTVSDSDITRNLLRPFLRHFRYTGEMNNYVWKAEKQKNGNIHYHVISDMFCQYSTILNYWNYQQSRTDMIDRFYLRFGHRMPNSVDIKQVRSETALAKYLSKYFSTPGEKIEGKTWDCSKALEKFEFPSCIIDTQVGNTVDNLAANYSQGSSQYDYCKVIYMDSKYYQSVI